MKTAEIVEISTTPFKIVTTDAKLTKSEVMDLVLDDMVRDLKEQHARAQAEADAATVALKDAVKMDDVKHLLSKGTVSVNFDHYDNEIGDYKPQLVVRLSIDKDDPKLGPIMVRRDIARAQVKALDAKLYELQCSRSTFKTSVLRSMLEATEEGRATLAAMTSMRIALQGKLLK